MGGRCVAENPGAGCQGLEVVLPIVCSKQKTSISSIPLLEIALRSPIEARAGGVLFWLLRRWKSALRCEFRLGGSIPTTCMHTNALQKFETDLKIFPDSMNLDRSSNLGGLDAELYMLKETADALTAAVGTSLRATDPWVG